MPAQPPARLGQSLDELDIVVATLRAFLERSAAERVVVVLDPGEDRLPIVVDLAPGQPVEVSEGEHGYVLADAVGAGATALPLPSVKALAPPEVDTAAGEIVAPMNAIEFMAVGVRELARLFGGRSVATVQFATTDEETPLVMAAREGEPMVLALGEEQFQMGEGWPGP